MAQKEVCTYSEIKIYTGNKRNVDDLIINKLILELVKKNQIDLKFRLAGVEFEEILIKKTSMKNISVEEEETNSGGLFVVLKGFFKPEDAEYIKYIRYCFCKYEKKINSSKVTSEVIHDIEINSKMQVISNCTNKEKETENYPELVFNATN